MQKIAKIYMINKIMQKKIPKILLIFFLIIFIFQLSCLFVLLAVPELSQAAGNEVQFVPQVGIGDDFQKGVAKSPDGSTALIGQYIRAIYKYAIGIVGIFAAVVLMFGGVLWLTAGGNTERIGNAKAWIGASLTGLLLALCSFLLLATINPALVDFNISQIEKIKKPAQKDIDSKAMEKRCDEECKDKPGQWEYDPKTDKCNCYGSGIHRECQMVDAIPIGSYEYKCVTVPVAGENTCTDDLMCKQELGCCRCVWTSLGIPFYTSCTSGINFTSKASCKDYCGWLPTSYFTPGAICDANKNCVKFSGGN